MSNKRLHSAVKIVGGPMRLARILGVGKNNIWNWLHRDNKAPPAEHCLAIEAATGGEITAEHLRPDVFCPPTTTQDDERSVDIDEQYKAH